MKQDIEGYERCNGCGVCALPCPIWQQRHEAVLTFAGRARALQGGARPEEFKDSVDACLLCGSCEPVCAMGIQTVDITLRLRGMLNASTFARPSGTRAGAASGRPLLLPSPALRTSPVLSRIASLLSAEVAVDDGADIIGAFERGGAPDEQRVMEFLQGLSSRGPVVVADGLFKRYFRAVLPHLRVRGLGEALLRLEAVRKALTPTDLYIIEARSYNMDFAHCMPFYTGVSRETGCGMNLDLQRVAIPTGPPITSRSPGVAAASARTPEASEQIRWIIEGRGFDRIVVEAVEDMALLEEAVRMPVVHVAELAGEGPS